MADNIEQSTTLDSVSTNSEYYPENPTIPAPTTSDSTPAVQTATPVPTPTETPTSNNSITQTSNNSITSTSSNAITVTAGEKVVVGGKVCEVKGYVTIGNGEIKTIYHYQDPDNTFNHYTGYLDSNNQLQKVEVLDTNTQKYKVGNEEVYFHDAEYIKNGKVVYETFTPGKTDQAGINNPFTNGYQLSYKDYVVIEGKELYVEGYVEDPTTGEKIAIYNNNGWGTYYLDKDGKLQKAVVNGKWVVGDGTGYHNASFIDGKTFEPSEMDKKVLSHGKYTGNEKDGTSETIDDDTQYITIPGGTRIPVRKEESATSNIEYNIDSELIVKRKRYYIHYYDTRDMVEGPYDASDARDLAKKTYNMTPGQGKGANSTSENLEGFIGSIKNVLEDVIKHAQDAVIIKGDNPGLQYAKSYESQLDEVIPPIYRKYATKCLPKAFAYSNNKQKETNGYKRNEVTRKKQSIYNSYKNTRQFNEDEAAALWNSMRISESDINERFAAAYQKYRTGHENTQSKPAVLSSLPVGTSEPVSADDMSVHIGKTDIIIDDLRLALNNYVKGALDLIDYQVSQLNAIPSFTSVVGTLRAEDVNSTLIELRSKLRSLREKYIGWREQAINVSQNKTAPVSPKPTPSPNGGYTGGYTPTPQPSPVTSAPTTEVPTDARPTEPPVVQPRIDDTNDNGGSSNGGGTPINGNSHGGDYSPYGGYSGSSSETSSTPSSTEVPLEETDVIKEGNSYTLPTSSKPATPSTPTTSKGNSAIPVLAGLAAAAAAGIGAKAYIDRKKNSNNDDDNQEEFKAEDWSDNNEINIEYQEPKTNEVETLDDDYEFEEPEKYGARSNQELENLQ